MLLVEVKAVGEGDLVRKGRAIAFNRPSAKSGKSHAVSGSPTGLEWMLVVDVGNRRRSMHELLAGDGATCTIHVLVGYNLYHS